MRAEALHDLVGVGHLGHLGRADETHRLEPAKAGRHKASDELEFHLGGQRDRVALQTVARTDLDDLHA
jgi:hypothetical protein